MIGVFDYTVVLTYLSLLSAAMGILISLQGSGHPYLGVFFLMFCGLCDAFDGKVARMKKDRTDLEKSFGVQIDSLSDLVAFGMLPACIGAAMIRVSPVLRELGESMKGSPWVAVLSIGLYVISLLFVLAALIRLAYFNVTEEERQKKEGGVRAFYTGLPVTSSALIFPTILLLQYLLPVDITPLYFGAMLLTGIAFLAKFQLKKPGMKGILIMIAIGAVEFALMVAIRLLRHY